MSLQERILETVGCRAMRPSTLYGTLTAEGREAVDAAVKALRARGELVLDCGHFRRAEVASVTGKGRPPRSRTRRPSAAATPGAPLTLREVEIADYAAAGLTSRQIAAQLGVAQKTITGALSSVYAKLGVRGREELGVALEEREGAA